MDSHQCCVCHQPISSEQTSYRIGVRLYCEEHFVETQNAMKPHWGSSGIVEIGSSVLFISILAALDQGIGFSNLLAVLSVFVPAAIWLGYVYRQDRLEPEPLGAVFGVAALGGLLTWTLVPALVDGLYHLESWQHQSFVSANIASIAVVATIVQLCIYVSVRYSIYLTDEFDELTDGVVYMTAAAIGSATALNLSFLLDNEGLTLAGSTLMMGTVLIHVAAAYPLGVMLSKLRFGQSNALSVGGVFAFSVMMNGVCTELMVSIASSGMTFKPWTALTICTGMAIVVLLIGSKVIDRLQKQTMEATNETSLMTVNYRQDVWVWGVSLLLLISAYGYSRSLIAGDQQESILGDTVELYVPFGWAGVEKEERYTAKPIGFEQFKPQLHVHKMTLQVGKPTKVASIDLKGLSIPEKHQFKTHKVEVEASVLDLVDMELLAIEERHRQQGSGFRIIKTEEKEAFGGHHSIWSWFAMVVDSKLEHEVPMVMYGVDVITIIKDTSNVYAISAWGPTTDWNHSQVEQLINGVVIK